MVAQLGAPVVGCAVSSLGQLARVSGLALRLTSGRKVLHPMVRRTLMLVPCRGWWLVWQNPPLPPPRPSQSACL